jgi:AcrR family transcriptional regulator
MGRSAYAHHVDPYDQDMPMSSAAKRTDPLTRAEIAKAALEMVDRDGVDRFSMRRLADELGVTTMAVYHHFENKAEILQAAADQVWIEVFASFETEGDPVERIFHRHSDVTPYAFASPTTEDAIHFAALGIAEIYERAGFLGSSAGEAYAILSTYTFGSALLHADRTLLDRRIRLPVSDLADLATGPLPEGTGEAYGSVRDALGHDPDLVRFERGLRTLVHALLERTGLDGAGDGSPDDRAG